ncbi:DUF1816 domain-containing protein [Phormidium sp. CLA17]|uniref:DUF1816 domain-containing protein n=1 Tax=Leptolyngbya sp. Cla-17 TaxID=2803751 RepID=UPI0014931F6A|nr:DUF1816 domain-containing protein [Leptolyngbya sp. Cla-17]MBM0743929.1 DUF1816 domain-containing protein [Leptolyngbya sp. Cla-17]
MQESLVRLVDFFGFAWWVKVKTNSPRCTYYFGPFLNRQQAEAEEPGYLEDLQFEGAQGIAVSIKRCKPTNLTVYDELAEPPAKSLKVSVL